MRYVFRAGVAAALLIGSPLVSQAEDNERPPGNPEASGVAPVPPRKVPEQPVVQEKGSVASTTSPPLSEVPPQRKPVRLMPPLVHRPVPPEPPPPDPP